MAIKRDSPYIWVTWLTKLMVGESFCEWATWFRAHHRKYEKVPDTFDSATWQMNHTELLNQVRARLEAEGRTVFTEHQNHFALRGTKATLGGKADLVAISGERGTVYDVKTGQPTASDHVQVMTYMYALPRAFKQYKNVEFDGVVAYRDHEVPISSASVNRSFIDGLAGLILRVSADDPVRKVPSALECGFCPISKTECPERVEDTGDIEENTVIDF